MPFHALWSNEHFAVESGMIFGGDTVRVTDLQPSILFYPKSLDAKYRLTETPALEPPPPFSSGELRAVWSIHPLEIVNPQVNPQKIVKVILKPSADSGQAFPPEFVGLASAALLAPGWNEEFRASVLEDLGAIGEFAQPFWTGETPSDDVVARAVLGKQDIDLKLQWSAGEYARRSVFSMGPSTPGSASSGGLITLTVNTRDAANTKDVSGYTVWYVARINRSNLASYRSFSKFSTPTSQSLAVGNYEVWAERNGLNGPRRTISVISVSTTQSADVTAP